MDRRIATSLLLAGVVTALACGHPSPGTETLHVERYGGTIEFVSGGALYGDGALYRGLSPEPTPFDIRLGDDTCGSLPFRPATLGTAEYADLGTALTFQNGSVIVESARAPDGSYSPAPTDIAAPSDPHWTLGNSGGPDLPASTIGTLFLPQRASYSSPQTFTPGASVDVQWQGARDADAVIIEVGGTNGWVYCNAAPDGSFQVPASVTAAAGGDGELYATAIRSDVIRVGDRDVVLVAFDY